MRLMFDPDEVDVVEQVLINTIGTDPASVHADAAEILFAIEQVRQRKNADNN